MKKICVLLTSFLIVCLFTFNVKALETPNLSNYENALAEINKEYHTHFMILTEELLIQATSHLLLCSD